MTIKELIDILEKYSSDSNIFMNNSDGGFYNPIEITYIYEDNGNVILDVM